MPRACRVPWLRTECRGQRLAVRTTCGLQPLGRQQRHDRALPTDGGYLWPRRLAAAPGVQSARMLGLVGLHHAGLSHAQRSTDPRNQSHARSAWGEAALITTHEVPQASAGQVLRAFLKLGLLSFGGPIAHLGYFRSEFVQRRKWLDDGAYGDLVALSQFLPGPASSQVGIGIGLRRAGIWGALAAWAGFTLPSAVLMCAFGYGVSWFGINTQAGWLHGLKIAAVAVVAQAVWGMGRSACVDPLRIALMLAAAAAMLLSRATMAQLAVIVIAAAIGAGLLRRQATPRAQPSVSMQLSL